MGWQIRLSLVSQDYHRRMKGQILFNGAPVYQVTDFPQIIGAEIKGVFDLSHSEDAFSSVWKDWVIHSCAGTVFICKSVVISLDMPTKEALLGKLCAIEKIMVWREQDHHPNQHPPLRGTPLKVYSDCIEALKGMIEDETKKRIEDLQLREEVRELRRRLGIGVIEEDLPDARVRDLDATTFGRLSISFVIPYSQLTLGAEIGAGQFGVVHRGVYQGATVAVKRLKTIMSDRAKGEFRHEAEIMFRLRHPNIIPLFGICNEPSHYCMVMQYATNGSLYHFLHSDNPLEWSLRWNIAIDIARGILHLHTQHVLHRDLKSLNVLLDGSMRAKITDFGLATVKSESRTATYSVDAMGSLLWMAPEILGLIARYSTASDIYAYAIILFEIATRELPYKQAASREAIITHVKSGGREKIPPECPSRYAALITRCWAQRVEDRPSIEEAVRELETSKPMP